MSVSNILSVNTSGQEWPPIFFWSLLEVDTLDNPLYQYRLGANLMESSSGKKDLEVLVENKLSMTSSVPWGTKRPVVSWDVLGRALPAGKGVLAPPLSPGEAHLECCVQCWVPQHQRDMELLEQVQQRLRRGLGDWSISLTGKG
ncbi:hypothetical protein BTVI_15419 [Pitangus sulphuratus]|nr:hypothetical protein BTVI_15419 [Pitangus sulphuratus]